MEYNITTCEKSSDNKYRFTLVQKGEKVLLVIGLNPSTADELKPDQTMRKVMGFAEGHGYDGFVMLNLSAERSTNPADMAQELNTDMHDRNLVAIRQVAGTYPVADVLVAFGDNVMTRAYLGKCFKDICAILQTTDRRWWKIGVFTKAGNPRHPLHTAWQDFTELDIASYLKGFAL